MRQISNQSNSAKEPHLDPASMVVQNSCVEIQLVVKNDVESISCKELHDVHKSIEQGIVGHVSIADSRQATLGRRWQLYAHPACGQARLVRSATHRVAHRIPRTPRETLSKLTQEYFLQSYRRCETRVPGGKQSEDRLTSTYPVCERLVMKIVKVVASCEL